MPETDDAGARSAAERLRAAVSGSPYAVSAGPLPLSVSVGVATVRQPGHGPRDALQRADRALYAAKEGGRDRVVMAA
ncbi:diguanylate cyclase [Piscinibacter aquaticus]|uniref:diguanylate cyclase n=1 Tax=Piscinibacter aquaticus TaxID=392597 RepID=A0A5C6U4D0_9BURK|nr:diguanylate cyclase [Piscinibacter aquaticus]